jgi:hypothetical protein
MTARAALPKEFAMYTHLHAARTTVLLAAVLAFGSLGGAPAAAQQPTAADLQVTVRSAADGAPLSGAQVTVTGTLVGGMTRPDGSIVLRGIAPGSVRIRVQHLGHEAESLSVDLEAGRLNEVEVRLEVLPIPVEAVEANVRASRSQQMLTDAGFFRRRGVNPGTFVTRAQIERRNPVRMSDMLRNMAGMQLTPTVAGQSRASSGREPRAVSCPIQYFVNGTPVNAFNIDDVRPEDVEGIEIYRGFSQIPPEFNRGMAMCGVIVIWTRLD